MGYNLSIVKRSTCIHGRALIFLRSSAGFTNHIYFCFMTLYFSEILAEALFSDIVPLGHFHRVMDLSGRDIKLFRSGCDVSSSDIIYEPSGRLKWCFRKGQSGVDLKSQL